MDIHLVCFQEATHIDQQKSVLSATERARAARFLRESDARAYIISHAKLRYILAEALGCSARDVNIEADQHGKPFLPDARHLHFNLSHAGDYALIAVSQAGEVGVDIEKINPQSDCAAIAQRFFAQDECRYIVSAASQLEAFFEVWTRKEAYVKAIGRGLAYGMDKFSVICATGQWVTQIDSYQLQSLEVPQGYRGAAAFKLNM